MRHTAAARHNPLGYLDTVQIAGRRVTLVGWTYDPDAPRTPIRMSAYLDGRRVLLARTAVTRPRVGRHYHRTIVKPGFRVSLGSSVGAHRLCVYGNNVAAGRNTRIACRTITVRAAVATSAAGKNAKIARLAKTFVGKVRFATAGTSPRTGFDCSGLTRYVYASQHISLAHSANAQYHRFRKISRSSARPGDLVFFLSGGSAYHVAVFEGGNKIVAAATYGEGVKYQSIWSSSVRFGTVLH